MTASTICMVCEKDDGTLTLNRGVFVCTACFEEDAIVVPIQDDSRITKYKTLLRLFYRVLQAQIERADKLLAERNLLVLELQRIRDAAKESTR